jgi:hypothetical protein
MAIEQRSRRSVLAPVLVLLLLVAVVAVVVAVVVTRDDSSSAKGDVSVQSCTADPTGDKPVARGQILNHSSKDSNYVIRLKFTDPQGNQVSEGVTAVKDVGRNATAAWDITGTRSAKAPVACTVTGVTRTHIPGQ